MLSEGFFPCQAMKLAVVYITCCHCPNCVLFFLTLIVQYNQKERKSWPYYVYLNVYKEKSYLFVTVYIHFFNHPKTKGNKFKSRIHIALSKNIFVGAVRSSSDSFDESSDESTEYRSDAETMSL